MSLDLNKLANKLDQALFNETSETLTKFLTDKRMSYNKETTDYKYPVGDFLSGFSDDSNNPCDYELECQRMVIRGVQYLNDNQDLVDKIAKEKLGVHDEALKPMIEHMCYPDESQTGAMVVHTVKVAYQAKKMGWDKYIKKITENNE